MEQSHTDPSVTPPKSCVDVNIHSKSSEQSLVKVRKNMQLLEFQLGLQLGILLAHLPGQVLNSALMRVQLLHQFVHLQHQYQEALAWPLIKQRRVVTVGQIT